MHLGHRQDNHEPHPELARQVSDRLQISETVVKYFSALDHKDWRLFDSTIADSVRVDFEQLTGNPPVSLDRSALVAMAENTFTGFKATQHLSTNHVIELSGDSAVCRAYMNAWHVGRGSDGVEAEYVVRGHYLLGLAREADRWVVNDYTQFVWHESGSRAMFDSITAQSFASETPTAKEA